MIIVQNVKISIIIPVHNDEAYLGEAIESVLAQTYTDYEIIVVDDGSTDGSAKVAQSFGNQIRYVYQENARAAAARNRGAKLAEGQFLAFLDADDLWTPNKLTDQVALLQSQSALEAVFGYVDHFYSPDLDEAMREKILRPKKPIPGYTSVTLLIRREAFFRVGLFNETVSVGEAVDWYARAKETNLAYTILPQVVYHRRLHANNTSLSRRADYTNYASILKAALDRRRAKSE